MSNLSELVDSLESSIGILLDQRKKLKEANVKLEMELEELRRAKLRCEEEMATWREKCHSLKLANSLLGSDQYKRETKIKINALIREIDQCIVQLSE